MRRDAVGVGDLEFAHALADAADLVSVAEFRSEELRASSKVDGTPVSQVDLDVEQAMLDLVRAERSDDAVIGEEVGEQAGTSGRRWIFDGIDGTHNYAAGRTGWGTIVGLEADGVVEAGMVSSPVLGRRWWAVRGGGAWSAAYTPTGQVDLDTATPLRCGAATELAGASVIVIPWEGMLTGWRDEVTKRFELPQSPRSQCFALDAVMVAGGELDVAILTLGGMWDFAATSLIVHEAGGVFRDAWGGERFDTWSGVFTNDALLDQVLAVLAAMRPAEPDRPQLSKLVSTPMGTEEEQQADEWRRFGIRPMVSMSAREHVDNAPPPVMEIVDERAAELAQPIRGVTTDGVLRSGLRSLGDAHVETRPIADAALAFLQALTPEQRDPGLVRPGRHRMAPVDQRAHEPLPARPPARRPADGGTRARARHPARHALRPRVSIRRARSCG